jgi:cell division protein FtsW (lipid II flippase)
MAILFSSAIILFISDVDYKFIFIPILSIFIFLIPVLYYFVPYVHDRLEVYIDPASADLQNDYYQLNQMIITTGSGEITGRGFGSSLQKFSGLLPEPLGDSIFAVYSEEFGFVGSVFLLLLFLLFLLFILSSAKKIKNNFEKMVVVGLGTMIIFPVFYNIGSSLGVVPLSGMPITFISKGGTAIFSALIMMGVILALTRKRR